MDHICNYLILDTRCDEQEADSDNDESCEICGGLQQNIYNLVWTGDPIRVSLEEATRGAMLPYLDAVISEHVGLTEAKDHTGIWYVGEHSLVELKGDIHLQDVPPNGTWLTSCDICLNSIVRLRAACLVCVQFPELNRIVLEQKNDDGLLYLMETILSETKQAYFTVNMFGPFASDVTLAPLLHTILRSEWVADRKNRLVANNQLQLGWAQEFYDYTSVARTGNEALVFTCLHNCDTACTGGDSICTVTRGILRLMRLAGYSPWSAVYATRVFEPDIEALQCDKCKTRLLGCCAFLMECAAVEADRAYDWLVRNEAVVELCWILYNVHRLVELDRAQDTLVKWSATITAHCMKYHICNIADDYDIEPLVAVFALDHVSASDVTQITSNTENVPAPCDELTARLTNNALYSPKRAYTRVHDYDINDSYRFIHTAVDVMENCSTFIETRPQDPKLVTSAILANFPRIATIALNQLSLDPPGQKQYASEIWPTFMNSTRSCFQLFRSLNIPAVPSPTYLLELFARGWRGVPECTLNRFLPTTTGPVIRISRAQYQSRFMEPLDNAVKASAISLAEKNRVIESLRRGTLPGFATCGASPCDRIVSSTLTFCFAACGTVALAPLSDELNATDNTRRVTYAGLIYFAAWYILVYIPAECHNSIMRSILSKSGSRSDACLHKAFCESDSEVSVSLYGVREISNAVRFVFESLLPQHTILRLLQLYVPEMLAQLPYVKKQTMFTVKNAIEHRDGSLKAEHGDHLVSRETKNSCGFMYMGRIAHNLYSSKHGTLYNYADRAPAESLLNVTGANFDFWCDTIFVYPRDTDTSASLRDVLINLTDTEVLSDIDDKIQTVVSTFTGPNIQSDMKSHERNEANREATLDVSAIIQRMTADSTHAASQVLTPEADEIDRCLCTGLKVDTITNMAFSEKFLFATTNAITSSAETNLVDLTIANPCMTHVGKTVYRVQSFKNRKIIRVNSTCEYKRLIDALWVFTGGDDTQEPRTPNALAVMVHLISKQFPDKHRSRLRVCNDIRSLCDLCNEPHQFTAIAAIVGGMYGVNITLRCETGTYEIGNSHYKTMTRDRCLQYTENGWCVYEDGNPLSAKNIIEDTTTIQEYLRLNGLALGDTMKDNYCGFHTVYALLNCSGLCTRDVRSTLVDKTVKYIVDKMGREDLAALLTYEHVKNPDELTVMLMTKNRWLSVHEIEFMLLAHGKLPCVVTENSYPLYKSNHVYFYIANSHFQPIFKST